MRLRSRLRSTPLLEGLRLLGPYLPNNHRWIFFLLAAVGVVNGLAEAAVLAFVGVLAATLAGELDASAFDILVIGSLDRELLVLIGLGLIVLMITMRALESYLVARLGTEPLTRIRDQLMRSYLTTNFTQQRSERAGELQDLLMSHVPRSAFMVFYIAGAVPAATMFVILSTAAAVINPIGFFLVVLVVMLLAAFTVPLQRLARRFGHLQNESSLQYAAMSTEAINASTEIRVFDAREAVGDWLLDGARNVSRHVRVAKTSTLFMPHLYRSLVLGLLLVGLGVLSASGVSDVASISTMVLLLIRALMASQIVNSYTQSATEFVPFVLEIDSRLAEYRRGEVMTGDAVLGPVESIRLEGVSHTYDGETDPVLTGVDLRIEGGETVGLLGPSGSGKSTLLAIVLGLIEPGTGVCRLNGRPPTDYTSVSWADQVASVPQDPLLITASVADNIRFFRTGISDAEVEAASRAAGIHDDVGTWPDGYETLIGERGARALSGGQRQRVCIARALVGKPSLLIMDEPTSALDMAAEVVVSATIEALGPGCTVIVVSHRETALGACDRLVRLDRGRLEVLA